MNPICEQARMGWDETIDANYVMIDIRRKPSKDNGFGKQVPDPFASEVILAPQKVRISHESKASDGPGPGGIEENLNRYIMIGFQGNIERGDVFGAYGKTFEIGIVDIIRAGDGIVGLRAPLINVSSEVSNT